MIRPQEERVRSSGDWVGAAISGASPLSAVPLTKTRGQKVSQTPEKGAQRFLWSDFLSLFVIFFFCPLRFKIMDDDSLTVAT